MRPNTLAPGAYLGRAGGTRRAGAFTLARTAYAPRQRLPTHAHGEAYLCLALAGSFRERARQGEREVTAGDVLFHPAGEVHADSFADEPALCLNIAVAPGWAAEHGRGWIDRDAALHLPAGAVGTLVHRLAREFEQEDDASELSLEGLTLELLARLVRDAGRRAEPCPPRWLPAVLDRLEDAAGRRLSLDELAQEARVHPATLARAFRRARGCSIGEYQRGLRLARACRALRASQAPLAEVAVECGFADQSHLTRALRQATGLSPAAYRRAHRR